MSCWERGTSLNNTITTPGAKLFNYLRTSLYKKWFSHSDLMGSMGYSFSKYPVGFSFETESEIRWRSTGFKPVKKLFEPWFIS